MTTFDVVRTVFWRMCVFGDVVSMASLSAAKQADFHTLYFIFRSLSTLRDQKILLLVVKVLLLLLLLLRIITKAHVCINPISLHSSLKSLAFYDQIGWSLYAGYSRWHSICCRQDVSKSIAGNIPGHLRQVVACTGFTKRVFTHEGTHTHTHARTHAHVLLCDDDGDNDDKVGDADCAKSILTFIDIINNCVN